MVKTCKYQLYLMVIIPMEAQDMARTDTGVTCVGIVPMVLYLSLSAWMKTNLIRPASTHAEGIGLSVMGRGSVELEVTKRGEELL